MRENEGNSRAEDFGNPEDCVVRRNPLDKGLFTRPGPQCAVCSAWQIPCPRCASGMAPATVSAEQVDRLLFEVATTASISRSETLLGGVLFQSIVNGGHRHHHVCKNIQPAGGKRWAERPDKARTGRFRSTTTVWFPRSAGLSAVLLAS